MNARLTALAATLASLLGACSAPSDAPSGWIGGDGGPASDGGADAPGEGGVDAGGSDAARPTFPPPVVTSMSPSAGAYGTRIVIEGEHLDGEGARVIFEGPGGDVVYTRDGSRTHAGQTPLAADVLQAWTPNRIEVRYPFPAEGAVHVAVGQASASAGTFTPTWTLGAPLPSAMGHANFRSVVSTAPGALATLFDGGQGDLVLVRTNGTKATSVTTATGGFGVAQLALAPDGTAHGFYASDAGEIFHATLDATSAPAWASTGITLPASRPVFAGAVDGAGPYVWIATADGRFERRRAPSWSTSEASVADPSLSDSMNADAGVSDAGAPSSYAGRVSALVGPDGSLYVAWGVPDAQPSLSLPHAARLRPGQASFDAPRTVGTDVWGDLIALELTTAGSDGSLSLSYCGTVSFFGSNACTVAYATASDVDTSVTSHAFVGIGTSHTLVGACNATSGALDVHDATSGTSIEPIYPCPDVAALVVDSASAPVMLLTAQNRTFAVRPR